MAVFLLVQNDANVTTDIVSFDVAPLESHDKLAIPTEYPVEDGGTVSDHIHVQADQVTLEVFVSNTPIRPNFIKARGRYAVRTLQLPAPFRPNRLFKGPTVATVGAGTRTGLAAIEERLTPKTVNATLLTFSSFDAVSETHLKLISLVGKARLRVVTSLTEYRDMWLTAVSTPRTISDGTGARFNLALKRINTVSAVTVAAPEIPLTAAGAPGKSRGGKGAKEVDREAARKANKSLALKLLQSGGFLK